MPRRSVGGYLRQHWLAIGLGVWVVLSEALILTQFPIDRPNVGEASQDAGQSQKTGRYVPPLRASWVPIRARLLRALDINLSFIDRYHDTLNAVSTLAVAIFTATLWSTTKRLYVAGEKQITLANRNAAAAEKAAEVATATLAESNRAWIKVSARLSQGLSVVDGKLTTSVIIDCKNIGNGPALRLSHHVWIRPWDVSLVQPSADIHARCEQARSDRPFHEFMLFAGETFPEMTQLGIWQFTTQVAIDEIWRTVEQKNQGVQFLIIMGCVNYRLPNDPDKVHQTRFMYDLVRPKALYFRNDEMPLLLEQVTLRKTMLAAGYYAD